MRVIQRGTPPSERLYRGSCHSCGSQIEAKRIELQKFETDQREGGEFARATCPVCGGEFVLYPHNEKTG